MNTNKSYHQIRSERIRLANEKSTHSKSEWLEMKVFFRNTCCKCFGESKLVNVEKDHIIPLYQGGSNHITNLQPLCARCNSSKGKENIDYRQQLCDFLKIQLPSKYKQII